MTIQDLKYFLEIYKLSSIIGASESMHVTSSALSQTITKLESELEVKLFYRVGRRIRPTQECIAIINDVEKIIDSFDLHTKNIQLKLKNLSSSVEIIAPSTLCRILLMPAISYISKKYPDFKCNLIEEKSDAIEKLIDSNTSNALGIVQSPLLLPDITNQVLFSTDFIMVLNKEHPYAKAHPPKDRKEIPEVDINKFRNDNFVVLQNTRFDNVADSVFNKFQIVPNICMKTNYQANLVEYIESNTSAVGFADELYAKYFNQKLNTTYIYRVKDFKARHETHAIMGKDKQLSENEKLFIKELKNFYHRNYT